MNFEIVHDFVSLVLGFKYNYVKCFRFAVREKMIVDRLEKRL